MTADEAIKEFKERIELGKKEYLKDIPEYIEALDMAIEALEKVEELKRLEEQGLLLRLPCKVGDTVWYIPSYNGKPLGFINKDKVQMIGFTSRGIHFKLREHHEHNKMYMLGKSVFLTREEAEAKLKEMR